MYAFEECALMIKSQEASQYQKSRVRINQFTHEHALKLKTKMEKEFMGFQQMKDSFFFFFHLFLLVGLLYNIVVGFVIH